MTIMNAAHLMLQDYPDVLTVYQVADILQVEHHTVRKLIHAGDIQAVKLGCHYRIPKLGLIEYICNVREDSA